MARRFRMGSPCGGYNKHHRFKEAGRLMRLPPPKQIVRLDPPLKGQECDEQIVYIESQNSAP